MDDIQIVPESDFGQKRIGILCLPGLETFITPIAAHFEEKYAVRTAYSNSIAELGSVVEWADLVIFEWANELAIKLTNEMPILADKKVLIRLHSYEALSNYAKQIRWEVVDSLIFVADHIKRIVLQQLPGLSNKVAIHTVPNGV